MNKIGYDYFLELLYSKYTKKSHLTEMLMDLLSIEREAVYRRLRKEVMFSIYEIIKIANTWDISLDSVFGIISEKSHPFQMYLFSYNNLTKKDLEVMEGILQFLQTLANSPDSEYL